MTETEPNLDQHGEFLNPGCGAPSQAAPYLFAQINKLRERKRRQGEDVIDLGMGNPSDPPSELVIEKLAEAARDPKNHGYSEAWGILNLRREVASRYYKRYEREARIRSKEVIVCLGSKEGFSHMCLALLGPGDTAIVPATLLSGPQFCCRACRRQPDPVGSGRP